MDNCVGRRGVRTNCSTAACTGIWGLARVTVHGDRAGDIRGAEHGRATWPIAPPAPLS